MGTTWIWLGALGLGVLLLRKASRIPGRALWTLAVLAGSYLLWRQGLQVWDLLAALWRYAGPYVTNLLTRLREVVAGSGWRA